MAINLPTLVQRVRVDTSGLSRAEAQAKSFAAAMTASSKDIDSSTTKLGKDTEQAAKATERSNAAHRETPGSVGPATSAIREHISANREHTTTSNSAGAATRRHARDHDALGNSVRKSTAEMKKAKTDSKVLGGVFKNLAKVMAPGMIVGVASFISPLLTVVSSLGAGAVAVAGQLGQMASAFAATGAAAVGSLSQVSGVVAALPGIAGALFTGMAAVKASFSGLGAYEKAVSTYGASSKQAQLAFSRLTPEVKNLSKEVGVYTSAFKQMGTITRSITVPGFVAGMQAAAPALGVLKIGARDLAKEIAPLAKSLGQFVGSKGFLSDLHVLATNNARVFGTLGGALVPLAKTFSNIAVSAAPMTLALAGAGRQFAQFLALKTDNRAGLTSFFNRAAVQAIALARSIGNVLGVLVRIGSIGASVFFGTKGLAGGILDSTTRLNTWVQSGEGVAKITGYFQRMKPIADNTFSAIVNFGAGLINLAKIGSNVFFGAGGMSGGIADVAKRFNDWTKSPGGIRAITGYFAEMKPIASEAMLLVKQVLIDLFSLSHDKSTASMLQMIRTDFLPIVTQMLQKMSTMAPAVLSTLKGVADFAGSLDPTVILAVANAFGTMVSNIGTLIGLIPGMGTIVSLLMSYLLARKLLGGVLVPLLGLAGGKGGIVSTLLGGATTAGGTLRAGGAAAAAEMRVGAAAAAAELRAAGGIAGAGSKAGTAANAASAAAAGGLGKPGKMAVLSSGAKTVLRGAIWAAIGYMIGDTVVNMTAGPAAKTGGEGAQQAVAAKNTWEASKKTAADAATYQKSLREAATKIKSSSDGLGGALLYGISNVGTGITNFFGGKNERNLSQAQADAVKAVDAETARVKLQTQAERAQWLLTAAGKKWLADQDKKKKAAAAATTPAQRNATVDKRNAGLLATDRQTVAAWDAAQRAKDNKDIRGAMRPQDKEPADVAAARARVAAQDKAATAAAAAATKKKALAAQQTKVTQLAIIAKQSAWAADQKTEGPGGRRYDAAKRATAAADAARLAAAQAELNRLKGVPTTKPYSRYGGAPLTPKTPVPAPGQFPYGRYGGAPLSAPPPKSPYGPYGGAPLGTPAPGGMNKPTPYSPTGGTVVPGRTNAQAFTQAAAAVPAPAPPKGGEQSWLDKGKSLMGSLARGIGGFSITGTITGLLSKLNPNFGSWFSKGAGLVSTLATGLSGGGVGALLNAAVGGIKTKVAPNFGTWWGKGWGLVQSLVTGLGSVSPSGIVGTIASKLNFSPGSWWSKGAGLVQSLVGALNIGPGAVFGPLASIAGALVPNFGSWKTAGYNLVMSLVNGLTGSIPFIGPILSNFGGWIKGFFGGSPVEQGPLMAFNNGKVGISLADKLAAGLTKGGPKVNKAAEGLAKSVAATTIPQMRGAVTSPFAPKPAATEVAGGAAAPRPVQFHIGTVQDGDTLLRRARATDRMLSLAEGGDSTQMRGIGI